MKEEMKKDFLSGLIPLLFANFWGGNLDTEQVVEKFIKEKNCNGREQTSTKH